MSSNDIVWVLIAILAVAALALAAVAVWRGSRGRRGHQLHERFGPEYDRLLQEYGDRRRVERELEARAERVRQYHIKELPEPQRNSFTRSWQQTQERFVDTPAVAVRAAHDLVQQVMLAKGYPVEESNDVEQRLADLSVDHASVVQHYRAALKLHEANRSGDADTEQLRQAIVHYRALFAELLGSTAELRHEPSRLAAADA